MFSISVLFLVFLCVLFWIFNICHRSSGKCSSQNSSLLVFEEAHLFYRLLPIIDILPENGLITILSFSALITGIIYHPAKFVIMTDLL